MMLSKSEPILATLNCWNEIGISGDRSCPELVELIHCRNCPVFAKAARGFFDRAAPEGYLREWSKQLAEPVAAANRETISLLVFRLGREYFGARSQIIAEVTLPRPIHSIPRRRSTIIEGIVNLRGQLHLQVAMKQLFGASAASDPGSSGAPVSERARLIVLKQGVEVWVFLADEVVEVKRYAGEEVRSVPSTLSNAGFSFSEGVVLEGGRTIGVLDDARIFKALRGLQG